MNYQAIENLPKTTDTLRLIVVLAKHVTPQESLWIFWKGEKQVKKVLTFILISWLTQSVSHNDLNELQNTFMISSQKLVVLTKAFG